MAFTWIRKLLAAAAPAATPARDDLLAKQSFIAQEPELVKDLNPQEVSGFLASGSGD